MLALQQGVPELPSPADVEVSIVSLGDAERLAACIESLPAACAGLSWCVTVVDNSPEGGDPSVFVDSAAPATVVRSRGRRGFGANQNLVLAELARSDRARYALILNDDTELDPDAVAALVRHADQHVRAGIVAPRIRDSRGGEEPSVCPWPSLWEQAAHAAFPRAKMRTSGESGWLNGACMLVRTSTLREVGLFDPSFFLFFEDADLCLRVARAGWTLDLCDAASIVHHGHQTITSPAHSAEAERQLLRSRYLFFRKHHGRAAARAVTELVRCILLVRAAKSLIETRLGRGRDGIATPGSLVALALTSPTRPTRFEREADRCVP